MPQMTLDDYRTSAQDTLGLDAQTASSADQTMVDRWVNEGVEEVVSRTMCQQRTSTLTLTSGTSEYALAFNGVQTDTFEDGQVSGWTVGGTNTFTASQATTRRGRYSGVITYVDTAVPLVERLYIPIIPQQAIEVVAYVWVTSNYDGTNPEFRLNFGNSTVDTDIPITAGVLNTWQKITVSKDANFETDASKTDDSSLMDLQFIESGTPPAAGNIYIDEITYPIAEPPPLQILHVKTQGTGSSRLLTRLSLTELLDKQTSTPATNSPVTHYAVSGWDRIHFYPTPDSAEVIDVAYVPTPKTLSNSAATPDEIPPQFHKMVEGYMLWKGASYDDDSTSGFGQQYQLQFERDLQAFRKYLAKRGGTRLSRAVVGNRSRSIRSSPDIYPPY